MLCHVDIKLSRRNKHFFTLRALSLTVRLLLTIIELCVEFVSEWSCPLVKGGSVTVAHRHPGPDAHVTMILAIAAHKGDVTRGESESIHGNIAFLHQPCVS